jgi:hypothetical protein
MRVRDDMHRRQRLGFGPECCGAKEQRGGEQRGHRLLFWQSLIEISKLN